MNFGCAEKARPKELCIYYSGTKTGRYDKIEKDNTLGRDDDNCDKRCIGRCSGSKT